MIKSKNWFYPLLLFLLAALPLGSLFHAGLFVSHDGRDHVARIANFFESLSEGNLIPRWAKNLNWGYGHPILMFLYPLSSYMGSFFHFVGFSFVDSAKLVFAFGFLFSGFFMYLWLKEFLSGKAAFVGGVLYLFAPYRFVNLYVRGAIGENLAFPFVPLICYFFLKLSQKFTYPRLVGASVSLCFLILAHNALSLVFLPFLIFYVLFLNFYQKKSSFKKLLPLFFPFILGLMLAAFFWLPAFYEGKYTLRDIVISPSNLQLHFSTVSQLLLPPWSIFRLSSEPNGLCFFLGVGQLLAIFISYYVVYLLKKKKAHLWLLLFFTQLSFLFTFFLLTSSSFFLWQKISLLQKFQFPWRLLSLPVFFASLLGASLFSVIKAPPKQNFLLIILCLLAVLSTLPLWRVDEYLFKPEAFYTGVFHSTTDTGESSPRWSVRFMEKEPKNWVEILSGQAEIKNLKRQSNLHVFEVKASSTTRILENTLYFPGWRIFVDGQETIPEFQDPSYRGLMTFWVTPGQHQVKIVFGETRFRQLADFVSVVGVIILVIVGLGYVKRS